MKVLYDPGTDILTVILKEGVPVVESDEDKPGVILDYDDEGNVRRVSEPFFTGDTPVYRVIERDALRRRHRLAHPRRLSPVARQSVASRD